MIYGSFNIQSFLLRTWADSPDTLEKHFPIKPIDVLSKNKLEIPNDEILIGIANFIHEYTHYIQTTSRLFNITHLDILRAQAGWTQDTVKRMREYNDGKYWPPKLPLALYFETNSCKEVFGDWKANWMGFETSNRIFWGQSIYESTP
jgi:hypothetical protein